MPRARTQVQALLGDKITIHRTDDGYLGAGVVGDYAECRSLAAKRPGTMAGGSEISVVAWARNRLYLLLVSSRVPKIVG